MNSSRRRNVLVTAVAAGTILVGGLVTHRTAARAQGGKPTDVAGAIGGVTLEERDRILNQAVASASALQSGFRRVGDTFATTRMHIAIVDRAGNLVGFRSMDDAWEGSRDIAIAKARTAAFFSSNQNALTSRSVGLASQAHFPDATGGTGPLWGIWDSNEPGITGGPETRNGVITFPGGVPLYRNGVLVGGVGVSGDGVDLDEAVAVAAAVGFEAPAEIRSDKIGLPYTK
jgi:uncharacterized protein GlcG (DUF336 family)